VLLIVVFDVQNLMPNAFETFVSVVNKSGFLPLQEKTNDYLELVLFDHMQ
jgi:hypothetical protein